MYFSIKQATVVFADIKGYTALMARDEKRAMMALDMFMGTLKREVKTHKGKILHFWGDGCLAMFDRADNALEFSIASQTEFMKNGISVRFGVNCGHIYHTPNNAYGHVVNVASRLESMAAAGSVLLSDCVVERLSPSFAHDVVSLGRFDFDNLDDIHEIYAIRSKGISFPDKDYCAHIGIDVPDRQTGLRKWSSMMMSSLVLWLRSLPGNPLMIQ